MSEHHSAGESEGMVPLLIGNMKSLSCGMIQLLKISLGNLDNVLVEGCGMVGATVQISGRFSGDTSHKTATQPVTDELYSYRMESK